MALGTALAIAGANLLGGIFGKKSADNAAEIQAQAAAAAGKKVEDTVASTNPLVTQAAQTAGDNAKATAATGSADVKTTAENAAQGVSGATTTANNLLNPYAAAGTTAAGVLDKGIAEGGDFNRRATAADIQIDPGYAYRQQQAELALERSAAAHGGVDNGGYLRDLNQEIQGQASQEYQKAFDRFRQNTQDRYANVFGVAKQGQEASTTMGNNLIGSETYGGNVRTNASQFGANLLQRGEEYAGNKNVDATNLTTGRTVHGSEVAGDYLTQGANVKAAGEVAGTNALWGGITGAVNSATNAYGLAKSPSRWAPSRTNVFRPQTMGATAS